MIKVAGMMYDEMLVCEFLHQIMLWLIAVLFCLDESSFWDKIFWKSCFLFICIVLISGANLLVIY